MLLKLSNLNSNLALTLGYLNPTLKNPALVLTRGYLLYQHTLWTFTNRECSQSNREKPPKSKPGFV